LIYFSFMSRYHDKWYTRLFSDPRIVEELLRSFVHESFVEELDFSSIKKLNTKFIPLSEKSRHADVVFEIKSRGQSAYIYLFLEFQSTVDRFMSLRMARYLFEFYQEMQQLTRNEKLNPPFPILIYNGDPKWTAPERFSELLYETGIPKEYLPEFRYFKIAINELPKRELVKIRNAVSAVFYIENSSTTEIARNRKELVSLLKAVLLKDGSEIVKAMVDRLFQLQKIPKTSGTISTIKDLMEVSSMLETNTKRWEEAVFARGIEQGIEKNLLEVIDKMIRNNMSNSDIQKITGASFGKIDQLRKRKKTVR
jgi:predicted transposase/invertase (TIGR01784 family)